MNLSDIPDKCRIWFTSTADRDIMNAEVEDLHINKYRERAVRRGEERHRMEDSDHDAIREEVMSNREMIHNMRVRISRIDERTAFMSKILFGIFLAFIVSIGAGLSLAFLFGP